MGDRKELEKKLLDKMKKELELSGFSAQILPSQKEDGEAVLLVVFNCAGDREDTLQIEVSFLPEKEEDIKELGFNALQIFSCIQEEIPLSTCNELARAVLKINPKVPAGAFGIDEIEKMLYYKSSCLITDNMEESVAYSLMEVHLGIFLNTLDYYNDVLMDIIDGYRTAEEAIKKGLV